MGKIAKFKKSPSDLPASCLLGISLGYPHPPEYYQGESLAEILNLIRESSFDQRFVMVADTLNAYNLIIGKVDWSLERDLEEARKEARENGQRWLDSPDGQMLQAGAMKWARPVIRWSEILEHPDYTEAKRRIDELYVPSGPAKQSLSRQAKIDQEVKDKVSFSDAVDREAVRRMESIRADFDKEHKSFDALRIKSLIVAYLKEECAAEIVIARNFACRYELYPRERNSATAWIYGKIIQPEFGNQVLEWMRIIVTDKQEPKCRKDVASASDVTCPVEGQGLSSLSKAKSSMARTIGLIGAFSKSANTVSTDTMDKTSNQSVGMSLIAGLQREVSVRSIAINGYLSDLMLFLCELGQETNLSPQNLAILRKISQDITLLPTNQQLAERGIASYEAQEQRSAEEKVSLPPIN